MRPIFEHVEFYSPLELEYLNRQVRLRDYIAEIVADEKAQRAQPAGPAEAAAEADPGTWRDRPPLF